MKTNRIKKRIFVFALAIVLVLGAMSTVFADNTVPAVSFTSSGVNYNKENNLLRFNLRWSHPNGDAITVMYSIDNSETKKLGEYDDQKDQVIAHVYLEGEEMKGSVLTIFAVDSDGNESEPISSEFQIATSSGITIEESEVPLSVSEGTWSLINLFLAALSVAMMAVTLMLFFENRKITGFRKSGKVNSVIVMLGTLLLTGANVTLLLTTQNLKHQMVMFDNMTIAMLLITVLCVSTTMILAVRAFGVQSNKEVARNF